ncbi:MAG: ThiF family adenylyltransferase [Alphaproteobacteria bacterium]|nr:ThiF family adenylyltransferase [Alphaproteobacteria bacterium]
MSRRPIARSPDLVRLLADGYHISIRHGHLVATKIPYVNAQRQVKYGILVAPLTLRNDVAIQPADHTIMFGGEYPCDQHGKPIEAVRNNSDSLRIADDLIVQHRFSAKPSAGNYVDFHEKIVTYAAAISGPAQIIDPAVKPNPGGFVPADETEDSIFNYMDTASPRAEITAVTAKLECRKLVIIGLGGTGSYILDQVSKTPIEQIHCYDGDIFEQHNAFRAPGAASGADLEAVMKKVDYYKAIYSKMHRGIVAHPYYVDASNIDELRDADFVFICIDDGIARRFIIEKLEEFGISFIDVGMGVVLCSDSLGGIVRTTASTPTARDHVCKRVSLSNTEDDKNEYDKNIQVADLNALNAALAVIKWKKLRGFYVDLEKEHHSTYTIDGNTIDSEDSK